MEDTEEELHKSKSLLDNVSIQKTPIPKCCYNKQIAIHFLLITALCLGYGIYGWMISYTSPTEKELLTIGIFDTLTFSIFSSLTLFGVSSFITSPFAKRWSCKFVMIVSTLSGGAGWLLIIVANDVYSMIAGRLLTGLHVGTCMGLSMIFIGEISNEEQVKVYAALVITPSAVALIFLYLFSVFLSFRWLGVVAMAAVLLQAVLLMLCPQSPTWLVYVGLDSRARDTLLAIHGETFDAEGEIDRIKTNLRVSNAQSVIASIRDLLRWKTLRPILIVCALQAFKGCSGQPIYYSYAASLFSKTPINPDIAALPYPILLSVGCLISVLLAKRVTRKKLLISTTAMQAVANFSFFLYFSLDGYFGDCADMSTSISCVMLSIWPMLSISVYSLFYNVGWGTIAWTVYTDSFDPNYKEISAGLVTLSYAVLLTGLVFVFPSFIEMFGDWPFFLLLSIECLVGIVFIYFVF